MVKIVLETIMTVKAKGDDVFISQTPLIPSDTPFEFKLLQFPIKLRYALTINKAQSQTFKVVGLDLTEDVFTHGQLYVGCPRIGSSEHLFFCDSGTQCTRNVV